MKNFKFTVFIFLFLISHVRTAFCEEALTVQDIQGTWTRAKYIRSLSSTRSPFSEQPETVIIKEDILSWTSYHEGYWQKILHIKKDKSNNVYRLLLGQREEEAPDSEMTEEALFQVTRRHDGKIETITFLDTSIVEYAHEPFVNTYIPLKQFVAQLVLVGTYLDEKGNTYSFEKSGMASWPGQSFSFRVALDSTEAFCDFFHVISYKQRNGYKPIESRAIKAAFKWVEGKLELYKVDGDGCCIECKGRPFAILTPQSK